MERTLVKVIISFLDGIAIHNLNVLMLYCEMPMPGNMQRHGTTTDEAVAQGLHYRTFCSFYPISSLSNDYTLKRK